MYGESNIGRVRKKNQDSFFFNESYGIAVVADGIGGRPFGELASKIAVNSIKHSYVACQSLREDEASQFLVRSIDAANTEIRDHGEKQPNTKGMGTTVNALMFVGGNLYIGHVGDSRTYYYRDGHYWQLTVDHSVGVYIEKGWFPPHSAQNQAKSAALVRALGLSEHCEPDVYEKKLRVGDVYLCCSDGLSGFVSDKRVTQILQSCGSDLSEAPKKLIKEANKNGGKDNITVVVAEVLA